MYQFSDYFDIEKEERPYSVPGEELEDYLRLLDMLLEGYLEFKGMNSQTKLFSRGLVVTESEMVSYFDMPPYFRERDMWDPVLAAAAEAAFSYIETRTTATRNTNSGESFLRVDHLKRIFDLSRTELLAVLLALAVEIDRRYERIYGFLQDDISNGYPSTGLLYALTGRINIRDGAEENIPQPLDPRMYRYFFIPPKGRESLHAPLILQPLMKKLLTGIPDSEESLPTVIRLYDEPDDIPVFFEESYHELTAAGSRQDNDAGHMIYLGNEDEETVLHLLYRYSAEKQQKLYILDMQQLIDLPEEQRRECVSEILIRMKLFNACLAVRYVFSENAPSSRHNPDSGIGLIKEIEPESAADILFIFGEKEEPGELASMFVPFLKITEAPVVLRTKIWEFFLNEAEDLTPGPEVNIPDMADCYEIPYGKIRKVAGHAIANARMKGQTVISQKLILDSMRQMNQVDFSGLATYVNPAYTWDDITITDSQKEILKTACDRYRLRNRIGEGWGLKRKNAYGNGVSILLYGPPGTGKTMAAQVIANELTLPLYRVDISQISSKYIGETEKNLAVIFNAAARANVILFFDEADALFSKRTSVGDSHDKYANSETAYLLQKIEEYDGMSILSTNYYNNFDDAFVRRITYSVHMQSPDKETRYTLWRTILPATAKKARGIDYKFLADKFELSGSNIKAILFNAAYMAGAENKAIGMPHIIRALEYEFTKLGKLVNSSDFGDYEKYLRTTEPKNKTTSKSTDSGTKKASAANGG